MIVQTKEGYILNMKKNCGKLKGRYDYIIVIIFGMWVYVKWIREDYFPFDHKNLVQNSDDRSMHL